MNTACGIALGALGGLTLGVTCASIASRRRNKNCGYYNNYNNGYNYLYSNNRLYNQYVYTNNPGSDITFDNMAWFEGNNCYSNYTGYGLGFGGFGCGFGGFGLGFGRGLGFGGFGMYF